MIPHPIEGYSTTNVLAMLHLPISSIPDAKNWKIDEEYEVTLKVRQIMLSRNEVGFEVIDVLDTAEKKEDEEKE